MAATHAVADYFLGHHSELGVRRLFGAAGGSLLDAEGIERVGTANMSNAARSGCVRPNWWIPRDSAHDVIIPEDARRLLAPVLDTAPI